MEIVHDPLDVPVVHCAGAPEEISLFVDFILTTGISEAPAVIEAEWDGSADTPAVWTVRKPREPGSVRTIASQEATLFRPSLARVNAHLLNGQVYGGAIRRVLRQQGRQVVAAIHTSNESATGFWIRVALGPSSGQ